MTFLLFERLPYTNALRYVLDLAEVCVGKVLKIGWGSLGLAMALYNAQAGPFRPELGLIFYKQLKAQPETPIDEAFARKGLEQIRRRNPQWTEEGFATDRVLAHFDALTTFLAEQRLRGERIRTALKVKLLGDLLAHARLTPFVFRPGTVDPAGFYEILDAFPAAALDGSWMDRLASLRIWGIGLHAALNLAPTPLKKKYQADFLEFYRQTVSFSFRSQMNSEELKALQAHQRHRGQALHLLGVGVAGQINQWLFRDLPKPEILDYVPETFLAKDANLDLQRRSSVQSEFMTQMGVLTALLLDLGPLEPDENLMLTLTLLALGSNEVHPGLQLFLEHWLSSMEPERRDFVLVKTPAGQWSLEYIRINSVTFDRPLHYDRDLEQGARLLALVLTRQAIPHLELPELEARVLELADKAHSAENFGKALDLYTGYKADHILHPRARANIMLETMDQNLLKALVTIPCSPDLEQVIHDRFKAHYGRFQSAMSEKSEHCFGKKISYF